MPTVISVSQNLHHLIGFQQRYPSFAVLLSIVKCSLLRFQFSEMYFAELRSHFSEISISVDVYMSGEIIYRKKFTFHHA